MNKYLLEILKIENTVIIPGIGALMVTNNKTGTLMFNPHLKFNDRTLEKYVEANSNMDEKESANFVAKYSRELLSELDKGEAYTIFGLGKFVKNGDEIVGVSGCWIGTKIWCGKYLEMDNVVVSSKFRSKGIGKMMSDFLAEVAEKENCKIMCLDAYTDNFGAGKFYMNQGFIPRGFHYIKMM